MLGPWIGDAELDLIAHQSCRFRGMSSRYDLSEEEMAFFARHAPVAEAMTGFYRRFQRESRQTPHPLKDL
jgi:hypothetical protein